MKNLNEYEEVCPMTSSREPGERWKDRPEGHEVEHPHHYDWHPVAECREITEYFSYNLGSAIAYLWRHDRKNGRQDLEKAIKHIEFEMERLYPNEEHLTHDSLLP
jgi:hypothetical protein